MVLCSECCLIKEVTLVADIERPATARAMTVSKNKKLYIHEYQGIFLKVLYIFFLGGWVGLFFVEFFYNPNISNPLYQFKITRLDCNLFISFMYWWTYFFTLSLQPTEQPNHRLNSCTSYLDRVLLRLGLLVMPLLFLL